MVFAAEYSMPSPNKYFIAFTNNYLIPSPNKYSIPYTNKSHSNFSSTIIGNNQTTKYAGLKVREE